MKFKLSCNKFCRFTCIGGLSQGHLSRFLLSFIDNRRQFVKVGNFTSSVLNIHAGTPQGTISGPNDFRLLINDLQFDLPYIKYVDDTTVTTSSDDPFDTALQGSVNHLCDWCQTNGMRVKVKEMVIYFGRMSGLDFIPNLAIGSDLIERVHSFKLLGVIFSSDLTWHRHISYLLGKVSKRFLLFGNYLGVVFTLMTL